MILISFSDYVFAVIEDAKSQRGLAQEMDSKPQRESTADADAKSQRGLAPEMDSKPQRGLTADALEMDSKPQRGSTADANANPLRGLVPEMDSKQQRGSTADANANPLRGLAPEMDSKQQRGSTADANANPLRGSAPEMDVNVGEEWPYVYFRFEPVDLPQELVVDKTYFQIPSNVTCYELNMLVNKIISSTHDDHNERQFDFEINGELLRSNLLEFGHERHLSRVCDFIDAFNPFLFGFTYHFSFLFFGLKLTSTFRLSPGVNMDYQVLPSRLEFFLFWYGFSWNV